MKDKVPLMPGRGKGEGGTPKALWLLTSLSVQETCQSQDGQRTRADFQNSASMKKD